MRATSTITFKISVSARPPPNPKIQERDHETPDIKINMILKINFVEDAKEWKWGLHTGTKMIKVDVFIKRIRGIFQKIRRHMMKNLRIEVIILLIRTAH